MLFCFFQLHTFLCGDRSLYWTVVPLQPLTQLPVYQTDERELSCLKEAKANIRVNELQNVESEMNSSA